MLQETITSPISKTSEQNTQLKIYNVYNAILIKQSSNVDNLDSHYLKKKNINLFRADIKCSLLFIILQQMLAMY